MKRMKHSPAWDLRRSWGRCVCRFRQRPAEQRCAEDHSLGSVYHSGTCWPGPTLPAAVLLWSQPHTWLVSGTPATIKNYLVNPAFHGDWVQINGKAELKFRYRNIKNILENAKSACITTIYLLESTGHLHKGLIVKKKTVAQLSPCFGYSEVMQT